jgi:hypothetical protein
MLQLGIEFGGFRTVGVNTNKSRFRKLYGIYVEGHHNVFYICKPKILEKREFATLNHFTFNDNTLVVRIWYRNNNLRKFLCQHREKISKAWKELSC